MTLFLLFSKQWKKFEYCVLVKRYYLMGKNTVQAKHWREKYYSKSVALTNNKFSMVLLILNEIVWAPKWLAASEKIKIILKIILNYRKMKLKEITDILKVPRGSVFTIKKTTRT